MQDAKYEYVRGTISPFPGGTLRHADLTGAVYASLRSQLRETTLEVYVFDVMTVTPNSVRYPDVVVTRGERNDDDPNQRTIRRPILIMEVLSESTEAADRGEKFAEYTSLPSLEEYVLVDSSRRRIERFRRGRGWEAEAPLSTGLLKLASIEAMLDLDELYDCARLDEPM